MNKEDKELLLKDLSTRLPYQPIVRWNNTDVVLTPVMLPVYIENCKPYLRPMSSMTMEELHELQEILGPGIEIRNNLIDILDSSIHVLSLLELQAVLDWLNAHHFDVRHLIEKGLAIDCTNLNVY